MYLQMNTEGSQTQETHAEAIFQSSLYPIDLSSHLALSPGMQDAEGVPYFEAPSQYHPTIIVRYALAHWNLYLKTSEEHHRRTFMTQVQWLVEHEVSINTDASGWPVSLPHSDVDGDALWLSASAQGGALSVLVRAYQLTGANTLLELIRRTIRTFERDILDGGISTPIGDTGVFFEDPAVYPALHTLSGCLFALLGLYDYVVFTADSQIEGLMKRSHITIHTLLNEFDTGFWTRTELLHRHLASYSQLSLQAELLRAFAICSGCEHCEKSAMRWRRYLHHFRPRVRYEVNRRYSSFQETLWNRVRPMLFHTPREVHPLHVCISIHAFPVTGGMRAVLAGVAQVTADKWKIEYLTQHVGAGSDDFTIHKFGTAKMSPWQFPMVWFYSLAECWKLTSLMRQGAGYHIILPQDGVFTSAFAAMAAKLAGVRVVCIDHGNLTLLKDPYYRAERVASLTTKNWSRPRRIIARLRFIGYWPTLNILARLSACFVDHYLIPGVTGDGVEEICKRLGVPVSRLTRFGSMIDANRFSPLNATTREAIRDNYGIVSDAIVIAMICRLAPEKGLDIALEAISRMLSQLSPSVSRRVRIIIAGDGPLYSHVEETIRMGGLSQNCVLWGETSTSDIISLLGLSDIFLYTSVRGACLSMAVLEAMASGCAVIASIRPLSNAQLLAEGRGIAVPAEDAEQTGTALVRLVNDIELCHQMGHSARDYIIFHHSGTMLKRVLMRATYWSALTEMLDDELKM